MPSPKALAQFQNTPLAQAITASNTQMNQARDEFLKDNNAWGELNALSNNVLLLLTQAPLAVSEFFKAPEVFSFVPSEEVSKTQTAVLTLTNTLEPLLRTFERLRDKHNGKDGSLSDPEEIEFLVYATSEYHNISEQFSGLCDDVMNYLYGVMSTTANNIQAASKAIEDPEAIKKLVDDAIAEEGSSAQS